jgi:hypothetical protein
MAVKDRSLLSTACTMVSCCCACIVGGGCSALLQRFGWLDANHQFNFEAVTRHQLVHSPSAVSHCVSLSLGRLHPTCVLLDHHGLASKLNLWRKLTRLPLWFEGYEHGLVHSPLTPADRARVAGACFHPHNTPMPRGRTIIDSVVAIRFQHPSWFALLEMGHPTPQTTSNRGCCEVVETVASARPTTLVLKSLVVSGSR